MDADAPAIAEHLIALASVAAVVWTGGLIVLQLGRGGQTVDLQRHHLINAGMACAAYGFLVPLFGLLTTGPIIRDIAIGATAVYLVMTVGNIKSIKEGLALKNYAGAFSGIGYLLPTVLLAFLIAFPNDDFVVWSSATLLFASYFILSFMARTPPPPLVHRRPNAPSGPGTKQP